MAGLIISTLVFFVAAYYIKRYLEDIGIPKTMVRGLVVFALATAISYGAAFLVDEAVAFIG